jgi:hypothetical protein
MTSEYNAASFIKYSVWLGAGAVAIWMLAVGFPDEASALLLVVVAAGIASRFFDTTRKKKNLLRRFSSELLSTARVWNVCPGVRSGLFFGGDAVTFHNQGAVIADYWNGLIDSRDWYYQWRLRRRVRVGE